MKGFALSTPTPSMVNTGGTIPTQAIATIPLPSVALSPDSNTNQPSPITIDLPTTQPTIGSVPASSVPTIAVTPPARGDAAWQALKEDYQPFDSPQLYTAPGTVLIWWYDARTAQFVAMGWIKPPFEVTGQFRLRGQWVEALEITFPLEGAYGLTLDASVIQRIRQAGYNDATIQTFIYRAPDIVMVQ